MLPVKCNIPPTMYSTTGGSSTKTNITSIFSIGIDKQTSSKNSYSCCYLTILNNLLIGMWYSQSINKIVWSQISNKHLEISYLKKGWTWGSEALMGDHINYTTGYRSIERPPMTRGELWWQREKSQNLYLPKEWWIVMSSSKEKECRNVQVWKTIVESSSLCMVIHSNKWMQENGCSTKDQHAPKKCLEL